ncbi:unnamed protein product [Mesocestoides corti]|uniref:Uncharacterized protein n=2 Tax=Mesocestoides corti TaxID=53468 RepID=A0A0R3UGZ2_MESCO|nr:unnamed protein product [Mesocestoides corti]
MTAHHSFDWAFGDYPKMSAALGGLHYLFKPLQVREMVGPEAKVDKLGLYDFSPKLLKFVEAVGEGMGVLRDIGDSDPERTAPPKIVEYIEARRPDWEAAGISLTVEDVIQMKDKYPMAYAVNRATIPNPNHHGKVVTAVYTPKSNTPITETIILVGKGVALDTGGADLKTEGGMYGMHNDKLGAAFVAGFFHTLSLLKPEGVKVIGYMPYIRNSIGKYAYLPDEIITLVNGLRVRIGDTDAEGRNIMSDVLYYAKEQAKKETNPHIFTIATLTGAASRSFGPYTVVMDNGPAEDVKMAQKMMACGDRIGDPAEVSRIRYEDFTPNMGNSEFIDIHQYNPYGGTSKRGHSFAMGFLSMASQIDKHGRNSGIPIPYTHCDIAGSGGGINELATAAPLRMFSLRFLWSPIPANCNRESLFGALMSRRAVKALVVYDPHPHVSIFRELAGYETVVTEEEEADEDNSAYLRSLDPKDWKTNDHYAVLNLKKLRYRASDEDVRKRYRQLVLKHHPDKRKARGENIKDISHDYFACITQAFEILGNPSKRHAYDSVDPHIPEVYPTAEQIKQDFFGCLNPFFMEKARWSKHQPTPFLGNQLTPLERVHHFYDFWDNYETTKDFSFLDEEDKEKGEDRESRRYIGRQNRAERQRRRHEEHRRMHQLVDLAREHDPRLIAAEKAAQEAKEMRKQARLEAIAKRRQEEEARARAEAAAVEAARAASAERQRQEAEAQKKAREQAKAAAKQEKKKLRNLCVNRYDHFIASTVADASSSSSSSLSPDLVKIQTLQDMELLCQVLSTLELAEFNAKLDTAKDPAESFVIWKDEIARARKVAEPPGLRAESKAAVNANDASSSSSSSSKWTLEMTQLLIKAVNLFPAGTQKRWEVIAAYVNQHLEGVSVTGKEALKQARSVRDDYGTLKEETNRKAFDSFTSSTKQVDATKSVTITDQIEADAFRPWTVAEQRALEKALRAHPARPDEPASERWQRIADEVGTRTRRECMLRFKDLAEQIRLKKAAMTAAGVSTKK